MIAGNIFFKLCDDGLANILGLETLPHGTNPINYCGIRLFGGDPKFGGKTSGSTYEWDYDDTTNYFYVFKDSEIGQYGNIRIRPPMSAVLIKMLHPKMHCFLSSYNFTAGLLPSSDKVIATISRGCLGTLSGLVGLLITPTLHFRFNKIDHTRFVEDEPYGGYAYKTSRKVEAWRVGILGSLVTGINFDWFSRVKASPLKILTGVVQLTCAVALISRAANCIFEQGDSTNSMTTPFFLGMLLA